MTKTRELKSFHYKGLTHIGNVRKDNEDTFEYIETVNGSVFVVCDGMGGVKGGKLAAETAVSAIKHFLNDEWFDDPKSLLTESIIRANTAVFKQFPDAIIRPGTTVVLALVRQNKIWYAHAGDSRLYYFTGKKLFQLTKDHSYVAELIDQKVITPDEALNHPRKNEITKALGIHHFISPSICNIPIEPADKDYLLLCTDGLTNELTNKEISAILSEDTKLEKKAKKLLRSALENGGFDNITIQLLCFYNTGKDENIDFTFNEKNTLKTRKYKLITLIFIAVIALTSAFLIKELVSKDRQISEDGIYKSKLNVKINNANDTLAEVFLSAKLTPEKIAERFHTEMNKIGYVSAGHNSQYVKYYIPVKNIYIYGTGSSFVLYGGFTKHKMIDLMIVNNKNELYFLPGEKIIIPNEKANGR